MKSANLAVSLFLFFAIGGFCTDIYAETSPNEIFKKATKLDCIFTSEQQTRWGSRGLMKEEVVDRNSGKNFVRRPQSESPH